MTLLLYVRLYITKSEEQILGDFISYRLLYTHGVLRVRQGNCVDAVAIGFTPAAENILNYKSFS